MDLVFWFQVLPEVLEANVLIAGTTHGGSTPAMALSASGLQCRSLPRDPLLLLSTSSNGVAVGAPLVGRSGFPKPERVWDQGCGGRHVPFPGDAFSFTRPFLLVLAWLGIRSGQFVAAPGDRRASLRSSRLKAVLRASSGRTRPGSGRNHRSPGPSIPCPWEDGDTIHAVDPVDLLCPRAAGLVVPQQDQRCPCMPSGCHQ